jgi:hypothetical protein
MSMPGFTAEVSVARTSHSYSTAGSARRASEAVLPSFGVVVPTPATLCLARCLGNCPLGPGGRDFDCITGCIERCAPAYVLSTHAVDTLLY